MRKGLPGVLGIVIATQLVATSLSEQASAKTVSAEVGGIALNQLPVEVSKTYQLVLRGGPFPFEKDGTVFGNRERLLPSKPRGYYREYTVPMNGNFRMRGVHRLVCGGEAVKPDNCYYSKDHYTSFSRIVP